MSTVVSHRDMTWQILHELMFDIGRLRMKRLFHRIGKFYTGVIINFIGIFIFVGILSVVFGDYGWLPNEDIYAISQFVYKIVLPLLIAYAAGNQVGHSGNSEGQGRLQMGGTIAVMAVSGMIPAENEIGILGAMLLGPFCGMVWKRVLEPGIRKVKTGMEMLARNVAVALAGGIMAAVAFYLIAPIIAAGADILLSGLEYLIGQRLICLAGIVIEPAKVFFLNNSINHGILIPLGMQHAEHAGESILFLLETNPGPGLGVLAALYLDKKEKRKEYAASMFVEFVGGIHEIYFPEVIANMWLLLALICGGVAGNLCFAKLGAAVKGVVSPGSILTVLLVCAQNRIAGVLIGITVSSAVSAAVATVILRWQRKRCGMHGGSVEKKIKPAVQPAAEECEEKMAIRKVGFICNAGVGSSAMAAALFRRKLRELNPAELKIDIEIEVEAYAADQIPPDLDVVICQKDLKEMLLPQMNGANVYTVESLLDQSEYAAIIEKLQMGGGKGI